MKATQSTIPQSIFSAACLSLTLALAATAEPFPKFKVDFSNGTPGSAPPTSAAVAGGTSTNATAVVTATGTSILIQDTWTNFSSTTVFGNGNVAVITDTSASSTANLRFWGAQSDRTVNDRVSVSLDMMLDNVPGSTGNMLLILRHTNSTTQAAIIGQLQLNLGTGVGSLSAYTNVGASAGAMSIPALGLGVAHRVEFVLHYDTGLYDLLYNGSLVATTNFATQQGFGGFDIFLGSSAIGTVAVDNFQIIPETGTISLILLGLGGMLSMFCRR